MHWALLLCRLFLSLELELNFKSMHETHNKNFRTVSSYRKFSPLYNWFEIVYRFFGNRVSYTLFLSQNNQEGLKYTKAKVLLHKYVYTVFESGKHAALQRSPISFK